jgi:hypothetical protein
MATCNCTVCFQLFLMLIDFFGFLWPPLEGERYIIRGNCTLVKFFDDVSMSFEENLYRFNVLVTNGPDSPSNGGSEYQHRMDQNNIYKNGMTNALFMLYVRLVSSL